MANDSRASDVPPAPPTVSQAKAPFSESIVTQNPRGGIIDANRPDHTAPVEVRSELHPALAQGMISSEEKRQREKRMIVKEMEVAAAAEAVWKALADGTQLAQWFPLEETFEAGVGGNLRLLWAGV